MAVRVIQAAFDRHAAKFANKGITAKVSKSADGCITVTLESNKPITNSDENEAVGIVAAFAVVEEILPEEVVSVEESAAAVPATTAVMAIVATIFAIL